MGTLLLSEKLCKVIEYSRLTDTEFAKKMQTTKQSVSQWKSGQAPIPFKKIMRIFELWPEINTHWFLRDIGYMLMDAEVEEPGCNDPVCVSEKKKLNEIIDSLNKQISEKDQIIIKLQQDMLEMLQTKKS